MILVTTVCLAALLQVALQCSPVKAGYDINVRFYDSYKCVAIYKFLYGWCTVFATIDIWLWILPVRFIYNLQMPKERKSGLVLIFTLAFFAIIFAWVKLAWIKTAYDSFDPTWNFFFLLIFTQLELTIGLTAASLPALGFLIFQLAPGGKSWQQRSQSLNSANMLGGKNPSGLEKNLQRTDYIARPPTHRTEKSSMFGDKYLSSQEEKLRGRIADLLGPDWNKPQDGPEAGLPSTKTKSSHTYVSYTPGNLRSRSLDALNLFLSDDERNPPPAVPEDEEHRAEAERQKSLRRQQRQERRQQNENQGSFRRPAPLDPMNLSPSPYNPDLPPILPFNAATAFSFDSSVPSRLVPASIAAATSTAAAPATDVYSPFIDIRSVHAESGSVLGQYSTDSPDRPQEGSPDPRVQPSTTSGSRRQTRAQQTLPQIHNGPRRYPYSNHRHNHQRRHSDSVSVSILRSISMRSGDEAGEGGANTGPGGTIVGLSRGSNRSFGAHSDRSDRVLSAATSAVLSASQYPYMMYFNRNSSVSLVIQNPDNGFGWSHAL
jgi:hypothetical protein